MSNKNIIGALGIFTLAMTFVSCKEIPVSVSNTTFVDTTYVTSAETPQPKQYLIEEFSGIRCVNCPRGIEILEDLDSTTFRDKLNIVSIYSSFQNTPPITGVVIGGETYNSVPMSPGTADDIENLLFGGGAAKPAIIVDRIKHPVDGVDNYYQINKDLFQSTIQKVVDAYPATPVNLAINCNQSSENEYTVDVKVSYTEASAQRMGITLYLVEDNIENLQVFPNNDSIGMYHYDGIFRGFLSSLYGEEILPDIATKEAGRVYIRRYTLKIDPTDAFEALWKPADLKVVALVHKVGDDDKQVYQSASAKLVQ